MRARLPYRSPPLTIEEAGPDQLRLTIKATDGVRTFGWIAIPSCLVAAPAVYHLVPDEIVGGLIAASLVAFACALIHFVTYRQVTLVDRARGTARQEKRILGIPTREVARLGDQPTADVETRVHTSRSRGHTSTTYDYVARLVGRDALRVGPARRHAVLAEADVAPLRQFLAGGRVERGARGRARAAHPDLDAWASPLAPSEASGNCPYCREPLELPAALVSCEQCRTGLHQACAIELGSCPTLGCRNQRQARRA